MILIFLLPFTIIYRSIASSSENKARPAHLSPYYSHIFHQNTTNCSAPFFPLKVQRMKCAAQRDPH